MRLSILLTLCFCYQVLAVEFQLLNKEHERSTNDILQWSVSGDKSWINFDCSKTPSLKITNPHGRIYQRAAFVYQDHQFDLNDKTGSGFLPSGERLLRIRHQARIAGEHTWQLLDPQNKILKNGKFNITENAQSSGIIKVSAINPKLLSDANENIFIPIGCNIAWANSPGRLIKMQTYLEQLAKNGGNHFRLWMCSWSGHPDSNQADQYRLDHCFLFDEIIKHAKTLNLKITVVFDNHNDLIHGNSVPYGKTTTERIKQFLGMPLSKQYQRRIHYVMARYGCDDTIMAWELYNELDEALYEQRLPKDMQDIHKICAQWVDAASTYVKAIDQDGHLLTSSLSWQTWSDVATSKQFDIFQVHSYIPVLDKIHRLHYDGLLPLQTHLNNMNKYPQPFRFSEVGHNGTNEYNPANKLDPGGYLMRQQAWAGFLMGSYGSGMCWWWDFYVEKNKLWQIYKPLSEITQLIDWQDKGLKALPLNDGSSLRVLGWQSTNQALLWPQIRQNTWHALTVRGQKPVTYNGQGLIIRGFMPDTAYAITWYSMEDGHKHSEIKEIANKDGKVQIICPKGHMLLVAHIRKAAAP